MKKPKIRFKGFTDDWEQRKLGEIADKVTEKNGNNEYNEPLTNSAEQGIISQKDYFDREVVNEENLHTYYIVRDNDFVYNPRVSTNAFVGPINRNRLGRNGVMSPLYTVFRTHDINYTYLEYYYKTTKWHRFMKFNGDSGARFDRFTISSTLFMKMPIPYPSIEEQKIIGKYFNTLDHLITLHQRKCEQLKTFKKYMLQNMFPENGEKVPKIRFKGFTDDWEQRKLGEILDIVIDKNGNTFDKEDVLSVSDEFGCVNQIKLQGRSFAGEDISNYKVVKKGDIIYTRSPLKLKPMGIIKIVGNEVGIVSPLYIVNRAKEGHNSQFVYSMFDSPHKTNSYLSPLVRKGAKNTMNISNDEWLSGKIMIPNFIEEQKQIGQYFSNFDNLITLHQRKCEQLKKLKKYMLQNMFI